MRSESQLLNEAMQFINKRNEYVDRVDSGASTITLDGNFSKMELLAIALNMGNLPEGLRKFYFG